MYINTLTSYLTINVPCIPAVPMTAHRTLYTCILVAYISHTAHRPCCPVFYANYTGALLNTNNLIHPWTIEIQFIEKSRPSKKLGSIAGPLASACGAARDADALTVQQHPLLLLSGTLWFFACYYFVFSFLTSLIIILFIINYHNDHTGAPLMSGTWRGSWSPSPS